MEGIDYHHALRIFDIGEGNEVWKIAGQDWHRLTTALFEFGFRWESKKAKTRVKASVRASSFTP